MAELQSSSAADKNSGKRTRKQAPRVDLTAMVDMAFLLITFFILTTTLQQPKIMPLVMPEVNGPYQTFVPETRTMTVLLGANNRLEWFMGLADKPLTSPAIDKAGKDGIRKALLEQSEKIRKQQGKEMIVLVKPSDKSTYNDMVSIMDELNITNNSIRSIVDITPVEVALLKRDKLYD